MTAQQIDSLLQLENDRPRLEADSLRGDNTTVGEVVDVVHVEDCCSNAGGSRSGFKRNFLNSSALFSVPWYLITNIITAE